MRFHDLVLLEPVKVPSAMSSYRQCRKDERKRSEQTKSSRPSSHANSTAENQAQRLDLFLMAAARGYDHYFEKVLGLDPEEWDSGVYATAKRKQNLGVDIIRTRSRDWLSAFPDGIDSTNQRGLAALHLVYRLTICTYPCCCCERIRRRSSHSLLFV